MSQTPISIRNPLKAAFLAWLVPGWGHFYQGRKGKAFLYFFCILGLYFVGLHDGGRKNRLLAMGQSVSKPREVLRSLSRSVLRRSGVAAGIDPGYASVSMALDPIPGGFLAEPSARSS